MAALISVKIYSLLPFAILILMFGFYALRSFKGFKTITQSFFVVVLVAFIFGGFWYLRSWICAGNPFFPFFGKFFGGAGFSHGAVGFAELPKNFLNLILLPYHLAVHPVVFGGEPLGLLFLCALPLLLFYARLPQAGRAAFGFSLAYLVAWYYSIQHVRFVFPVLPFLALSFSLLFEMWYRQAGIKKIHKFFLTVLTAAHFLLSVHYPTRMVPAALGLVSADGYLSYYERTYPLMRAIQPCVGAKDKILFTTESRLFYSPVRAIDYTPAIDIYCRRQGLGFSEWLRKEGVTHFLTSYTEIYQGTVFEKLKDSLAGVEMSKVLEFKVQAKTESRSYHYTLWKLGP